MTLSTSYAFGDIFGTRHSLNRSVRDAKFFYATFAGIVAAGRRHRPHPRRAPRAHHHRGPGAGRDPAAERHGLPAPAVQRQGRARPMGQPALAQRRVDVHRLGAVRLVPDPDDHHGVPPHRRARSAGRALGGAGGWSSWWRGRCTCELFAAAPLPTPSNARGAMTWRMPPLALIERPTWTRGRTDHDVPDVRLSLRGGGPVVRQGHPARLTTRGRLGPTPPPRDTFEPWT